jgi:hypothetical protein
MGRADLRPRRAACVALARSLVGRRVLVVVAHALQRAEHGEQPVWMAGVLAAALGQIGLPGGGYNYALGTLAHYGKRSNAVPAAALPQGTNGVKAFIPVARIADMLLNPGTALRLQRPAPDLSACAAGLLGRRQPLPPPPGPDAPDRGLPHGSTPSSCTRPPGRRRRAMPTSCCPAR